MAGALIGALRVTLGIDTAAFEQGLGIAQKRLTSASKNMQAFGAKMTGIGQTMSVAVTAPLVAFAVSAVGAANESAEAMAQVNAALKSMGPMAGKTSEQLEKAAAGLQHISTYDDDDILRKVTANMLTFGNVSGEAFDRAQLAAVNLSARLGQDLQSSAVMLGKALNDPIKGITALSRVGVSFTEQQKDQIKAMAAAGDVAGAQALILNELEKQYGGAAKAARDAAPGSDTIDAWREFQETIGAIIVEVLPPLTDMLTRVLESFNNLSPGTQSFIVGFAAIAAAVGPVLIIVGSLVSAVGAILPAFAGVVALFSGTAAAAGTVAAGTAAAGAAAGTAATGIGAALAAAATAALPFIAAGAALAAAWYLFGDKIKPVLDALSTKFQEVLGPKLQSLFNTIKTTLTELWNGPFGQAIRVVIDVLGDLSAAYMSVFGEVLIRVLSTLVTIVENTFRTIGDIFRVIAKLLTGDFAGAWEAVKTLVGNVVKGWIDVLKSLAPEAITAVKSMASGVTTWLSDLASRMVTFGRNIVQGLVKGILAAPQAVWNALKSVVMTGVDNVRAFLGIKSPSRLFMEMGGHVTDGFAIGIKNGTPTVQKAMGEFGQIVADSFAGIGAGTGISIDPTMDFPEASNDNEDTGDGMPGEDKAKEMKDSFQRAFSDGIKAALDGDLKGFFQNWFEGVGNRAFENILNTVSGALFDLLGNVLGGTSGGAGGGLGGILSGVVGALSGRASGGPVHANTPYIVGENRAELFVPSTAGRIEPKLNSTGRRAANDGQTPSMNFNFYGPVTNPQEVKRSTAQASAQFLRVSQMGRRGS